jgi:phosphoribosylamine--glycine ligase
VVVEEGLTGSELSVLCVCDGVTGVPLAPAQDFKRVGDGDAGPNTGGMGAFSPVAGVDMDMVVDVAIAPTLQALRKRDIDYRGVLYAGLMRTPEGLKVIEFNVRFGDPEAQVVLPRLSCDLAGMLAEAAAGKTQTAPTFVSDAAICVVLAVEGYPESPRPGDVIAGIDGAEALDGVTVYCAGVAAGGRAGELITAGGRVLNVTARASTIAAARERAYEGVGRISWPGMQFRTDIAAAAANKEL